MWFRQSSWWNVNVTPWVGAYLSQFYTEKFGGHSHPGSEVILILGCDVISEDHVMKGSCGFMDGSLSW